MLLKKEEFWARLKKGKIDPVYFFYGQEEFLIRESIDKIKADFLGQEANKFQSHYLYGDEVSIDELIQLASTLPFGKSKRVISYQLSNRLKAADKDLMMRYVDHPAKDTILNLIAVEMDISPAMLKHFKEKAIVVRFYPLFKNQIPDWIKKYAARIGIQISHGAAQLMEEFIGSDLSLLSNELQRIALYVHPRKKIDIKEVEEVVGHAKIFSIFELTKSLGEKRVGQSFRILQQLLDVGQLPVGIIALIAHHFRRLNTVKDLISQGKPQTEIARNIGIPPTFLNEFLQQLQLFSLSEIRTIFDCLLEADLQLKSSALSQDIVLESLIFKICGSNFSFCHFIG